MREPPEFCPVCGAEVPRDALACPECGSDEETGWSDRARAQELGLPDDEFDYDEYLKEEFGEPEDKFRPRGISLLWWGVAILLLASVIFVFVFVLR
jgi:predicted nucleic acid-binding Zn ribbon protein